MRDWQMIETAPKDGTWVLAWGIDGSVQRVSWGRTRQGELAWCTPHGWCAFRYLTHWMPLPDPPKVIEVERIPVSDDQSQAITEALHQGKKMNR